MREREPGSVPRTDQYMAGELSEYSEYVVEAPVVMKWDLYRPLEGYQTRTEYFLDKHSLRLKADFARPVELRLGWDERTPPCYLVRGQRCKQIGAEFIVVQPTVVRDNPARGWIPIGGRFDSDIDLGRDASPELRLGLDVDYLACSISADGSRVIDIINEGGSGVRVVTTPDDLAEDFEEWNRKLEAETG